MKAYKKKISKKRVYREYVNILNGVLQLSYREADVFAILLQLRLEWGEMFDQVGNAMSTDIRRVLMKETRITKSNLHRYLSTLHEKGILVKDEKGHMILNEVFVPEIKDNVCNVTFTLEIAE